MHPQPKPLSAEPDHCNAEPAAWAAGYLAGYNSALEAAAKAIEQPDKTGREWVPGSLWDTLVKECSARVRALKRETI